VLSKNPDDRYQSCVEFDEFHAFEDSGFEFLDGPVGLGKEFLIIGAGLVQRGQPVGNLL
jgi:hypothetical protein